MSLEWMNPRVVPLSRLSKDDWQEPVTGWQPGDVCADWVNQAGYGLIVSVINDENMLVLWSKRPVTSNPCSEVDLGQLTAMHANGFISKGALLRAAGLA